MHQPQPRVALIHPWNVHNDYLKRLIERSIRKGECFMRQILDASFGQMLSKPSPKISGQERRCKLVRRSDEMLNPVSVG
jgi:hypothetical protein